MYKRLKGLANLYNSGKGGSWIIILFISLCLGFFYLSIIWGNSNAFYYPRSGKYFCVDKEGMHPYKLTILSNL